jgi:Flp pilus assembly protein TadD
MGLFLRRGMTAAFAASFIVLAGCKGVTGQSEITTGSVNTSTQEAYRKLAETWGKRYQANPGDKTASLNYARALRGIDERQQAVSVLQQAAARNPEDQDILAAYGKALVEVGQFDQARIVLSRAHTPDMPNARILSAQAVIADQTGDHQRAQALYRSALKQDPHDPVILTNMGLSLILSRQSREAEAILRRAVASPRADARMRQTLGLALIVNGKSDEAASVLAVDMPPQNARHKVAEMQRGAAGEGLMAVAKSVQTADAPLRPATSGNPSTKSKPTLRAGANEATAAAAATAAAPTAPAPLQLRSAMPEG